MKRLGLLVLSYGPAAVLTVAALFQPNPWGLIIIGLAMVHAELVTWRLERLDNRRRAITVTTWTQGQQTDFSVPGTWST